MQRTLLGIVLLVLASSAANAVIIWNESINGDLAGSNGVYPAPTTLTAALGANTVIGSLDVGRQLNNCVPQPNGGCIFITLVYADIDRLWLDIPDGARITDMSFTLNSPAFSNVPFSPSTSSIDFTFLLRSALPFGFGDITGTSFNTYAEGADYSEATGLSASGHPFSGLMPMNGDRGLELSGNVMCSVVNSLGCNALLNYTLAFQVEASVVPIPPAVWLFSSALGLMGMARRKFSS